MKIQEELAREIHAAVSAVLNKLYQNQEHYYYITLVSDGGANTPCICAWSQEALENSSEDAEEREDLKWSYADSPYCCFYQEAFAKVEQMLLERENVWDLPEDAFLEECGMRYAAMEEAMMQLDREGLFAVNQKREDVVVLVETMPPDETNTERALRMNQRGSAIFEEWLKEAAE